MAKVERVEDTAPGIEVFENDIELYITDFCERYEVEDLRAASQNIWNGVLRYVFKMVFKGRDLLKLPNEKDKYNVFLVDQLVDNYIDICGRFDKIPGIVGFSYMCGIDTETINNWGYANNRYNPNTAIYIDGEGNSVNLTSIRVGIYQKLSRGRAEGLEARLVTWKNNPVGLLGALNHYENWNLPGVSKEATKIETQTAGQIADKYGNNSGFLQDNSAPNAPE